MTKVFITGITGFKGSHLAELLISQGAEVYGSYRWRSKTENIDHLMGKITCINADIRDGYSIAQTMRDVRPDYVFHLAAQSFVAESWRAPSECLNTNIQGTLNLLEAVRAGSNDSVVVIAGSSEEYGLVYPKELPITEENPLRPLSPYAVSKVASDLLGRQYYRSYGMKVIVTRAFNTTGPRRGEVFATSSFAKQVAEVEAGKRQPVIFVGNLDSSRDFTDVRDMVRAYWAVAQKGVYGEVYNMCSGKSYKMKYVLDYLVSLSRVEVRIEVASDRLRPSDVPVLQGDSTRLRECTGWQPTIPFEKTLEDLLEYWRQRIK